jgi:energy-converting hydrogenase Eha subunit A
VNDRELQTLRLAATAMTKTLRTIGYDGLFGDEIATVMGVLSDALTALGCDPEYAWAVAYGVTVDVFLDDA